MIRKKEILARIKQSVQSSEPQATVILYGSFARGDNKEFSDIDILILLDQEKITYSDETRIKYPGIRHRQCNESAYILKK